MKIYIPSRSRAGVVPTLDHIPSKWLDRTHLVVNKSQFRLYDDHYGDKVTVLPAPMPGIHNVRQFIVDIEPEAALMIDDDMKFFVRPSMEYAALKEADHAEVSRMLNTIKKDIKKFWAVAISARQGNNHHSTPYVDVHRMNNMYAINTHMIHRACVKFNRLRVMEDFDVTLSMLRQGLPNRVYYKWAWNQRGSGASGGCSDYRTGDMQKKAAHQLKKRHPDYVTIVEKESKSGWHGMTTRTDVRIQWKKAYKESQS